MQTYSPQVRRRPPPPCSPSPALCAVCKQRARCCAAAVSGTRVPPPQAPLRSARLAPGSRRAWTSSASGFCPSPGTRTRRCSRSCTRCAVTGKYFVPVARAFRTNPLAADTSTQAKLWEFTEHILRARGYTDYEHKHSRSATHQASEWVSGPLAASGWDWLADARTCACMHTRAHAPTQLVYNTCCTPPTGSSVTHSVLHSFTVARTP